jgi:hypothetical protein
LQLFYLERGCFKKPSSRSDAKKKAFSFLKKARTDLLKKEKSQIVFVPKAAKATFDTAFFYNILA